MAALAPRSIVPRVAFGFNSSVSTPVVALEQESLTYITFTGSRAAFVSAEEIGGENLAEGSSKPMHFFPAIRVRGTPARVVTAVAFHKRRKLLGLCVSQLPRAAPPAVVVYSLAQCGGAWVPTVVGTHTWDEAPGGATFGAADFNADASLVVCARRRRARRRERADAREGVHLSSVRGVVPLEHGFATCCSSCGVCVFRRDDDPRQRKRGKVGVKLMRRLALDGARNVVACSSFPPANANSAAATLLVCRHAVALLDLPQLLLTTDPKAKRLPAKRLGAPHHEGDVMALSAGLSKPLLASCSTVGGAVCVWDWRARELAVRYVGDEAFAKQALVCLDVHPGGYELLVGLEDEMRVYRLGHRELFLAQKLATKGVVPLPRDDRPLVSTTPLSALAYANGGHLFAAVMGRLVQVFESRATRGGRACCRARGHAGNVRGLAWAPDDQRLFTVSEDGAVYEWSIGRFEDRHRIVARTRDCVRLGVKWACMCVFDDGALVAAGAPRGSENRRGRDASPAGGEGRVEEPLVCVWPGAIGGPSTDVLLGDRVVTCLLPVDPAGDAAGLLVAGTAFGSVVTARWPFDGPDGAPGDLRELPLCDGAVVALTFCRRDDTLCAAGRGGAILVCSAGRDGFLGVRAAQGRTRVIQVRFNVSVPRARVPEKSIHASRALRGMIARPKISRNEWKMTEIGASKVGNFAPLSRPGASLKQAQAFGGPSDEMVLIERGAFYKLENDVRTLVGQLEQTKAAAKQQQDAARPEFERRLGEQEESYEAQLEALETEVDGVTRRLAEAEDGHAVALAEARAGFDAEAKELESLYDKKLATEAARYMAIRDEIDKIRLDARDELESQVLDSRKSEEKWKKSKESLKETYEAEARLLRDYAAKREASGLLEEQDRRADLELFAAREAARADLELQRKLTTSLHDKAVLKRRNEQLSMDYHKNRDELTESQQAFYAARDRAADAEARLGAALADLRRERASASATRLAADQEKQLDDLVRWKRMLGEQKASSRRRSRPRTATSPRSRRSGASSAASSRTGMQNKAMGITLNRKANELQRARTRVGECRKHIFSKDKRLGGLVEQIDVFLLKLRDPAIRPQAVVLEELHAVRDAVVRLQPARHRAGPPEPDGGAGDDDGASDDKRDARAPQAQAPAQGHRAPDFRTKLPDHAGPSRS
ncbi:hypothetical protein JL722_11495 [Aureococcus anophagefferens]|nr:hypothetical protein JL722_11495 [Aureococcus anophagefferens]